jgi:uncharacterized protein with gpF-like domain
MKRKIKRDTNKQYVRGKPLHIPCGIQLKYVHAIDDMTRRMAEDAHKRIIALFETFKDHFATDGNTVGMDALSFDSQARILVNKLKLQWDQLFGKLAMGLSPWMANSINRASSDSVRQSVESLPNLHAEGAKLSIDIATLSAQTKTLLGASSVRSSDFIRSIPEKHLNDVAAATYNSITSGNGVADLIPFFEKHDKGIMNWAHNTAMDQTRKTYNGLNLGRMKKIGIKKGEWIHTGGSQHPREEHEDADGETFELDKGLPIGDDGGYVLPGDDPNCRCSFAPVVEFDDDDE